MPRVQKRVVRMAAITAATIAVDQITKALARAILEDAGTVRLPANVFILHYVENAGAFLGLGAGWPPALRVVVFTVVPFLLVCAAAVYVLSRPRLSRGLLVGASLIVGGGVGNLLDRLMYGSVTDFMNIGIGSLRTGIFNFADLFLMLGAALIIVCSLGREQDADRDRR